jgi:hypothetical protein
MIAIIAADGHLEGALPPSVESDAPPPNAAGHTKVNSAQDRAVDGKVPLHRGAAFLMRMQRPNGDWPQQHISGVFNRNCMITYANYRNLFPIWALGLYRRCVLNGEPFEKANPG